MLGDLGIKISCPAFRLGKNFMINMCCLCITVLVCLQEPALT